MTAAELEVFERIRERIESGWREDCNHSSEEGPCDFEDLKEPSFDLRLSRSKKR